MSSFLKFAFVLILLAGCETPSESKQVSDSSSTQESDLPKVNWKEGERTTDDAPATGEFKVKFETTAGDFTMRVHRDWAPRGAERFHQLIKSKYYDGSPFYRVIPSFMVQFGMCGDAKGTQYWNESFKDDPVKQSNTVGKVTYAMAGPNTRSTQLFINYADNAGLDRQGFAPFGEITEGMENVRKINAKYSERPSQGKMAREGNKYVFKEFPEISYITRAFFVDDEGKEIEGGEQAEGEAKEGEHAEHSEEDHDHKHEESGSGKKDK